MLRGNEAEPSQHLSAAAHWQYIHIFKYNILFNLTTCFTLHNTLQQPYVGFVLHTEREMWAPII